MYTYIYLFNLFLQTIKIPRIRSVSSPYFRKTEPQILVHLRNFSTSPKLTARLRAVPWSFEWDSLQRLFAPYDCTWNWMIGKPCRYDPVWYGSYSQLFVQLADRYVTFRTWRCVVRPAVGDLSNERTATIFRNVWKCSPNDTASHSRRL